MNSVFDLSKFRLVPYRDEPVRDMLFTDRVGPWWDTDGAEIVLPVSDAFDRVADRLDGTWEIHITSPSSMTLHSKSGFHI